MMTTQPKLMTAEEFWELYGSSDEDVELIRGEIVKRPVPGIKHGAVARRLSAKLGEFVDAHELGDVLVETDFRLTSDSVVRPDVAFVSRAKLQTLADTDQVAPFVPDLAIEVISPGNSAFEIEQKIKLFIMSGTPMVWIVYPNLQEVIIHYPDRTSRT
ncbi:MAG TPA: Uma2 family endonuclease, partial [Aggregatilineales bacterium]|nr:Uma2 family endonuclease [Aggregatilineales bacterium]